MTDEDIVDKGSLRYVRFNSLFFKYIVAFLWKNCRNLLDVFLVEGCCLWLDVIEDIRLREYITDVCACRYAVFFGYLTDKVVLLFVDAESDVFFIAVRTAFLRSVVNGFMMSILDGLNRLFFRSVIDFFIFYIDGFYGLFHLGDYCLEFFLVSVLYLRRDRLPVEAVCFHRIGLYGVRRGAETGKGEKEGEVEVLFKPEQFVHGDIILLPVDIRGVAVFGGFTPGTG